jgi:adenosylcobinamide-phosphate synthase
LAQKSLREHVTAVHSALGESIEAAREQVAKIVGRDPQNLDESGISKAALESLAENTSDGIVAPALWFTILGLPGLAMYKMINTADSMIGHRSDRYLHFGWASARLDDLVNLPASRLTGYLFAAVAWLTSREAARSAIRSMHRDARHHGSPNAGWPEAAMAGALGLRFGGTRDYDGTTVDLPWMGEGRSDLEREDIARGLTVFDQSMTLLAAGFLGLAIAL